MESNFHLQVTYVPLIVGDSDIDSCGICKHVDNLSYVLAYNKNKTFYVH